MNSRLYTRYLEKKWASTAPDDWEPQVWIRIGTESLFWCSAQLILIWIAYNMAHKIAVDTITVLWLVVSAAIYLLAGFAWSHLSVSIGRFLSVIALWVSVYAAI